MTTTINENQYERNKEGRELDNIAYKVQRALNSKVGFQLN
jgi:hypothetical protein